MRRRRQRFLLYIATFALVIALYTIAYIVGMAIFEDESRSVAQALLVVVETFTTTGYGEDADAWQSPQLIALVVLMQFTGVLFIFMALPLFVAPWIEGRLSTTPPDAVEDISDHVVVCSFTERIGTLIDELTAAGVPYVIVEPDRETAVELIEAGYTVVHGNPEREETLANARMDHGRALVIDIDDETNASIVLAADDFCSNGDVSIISFAGDPEIAEYHRYAGADAVLSPRQLIGESLANKVTAGANADVGDAIEIEDDFEIAELPVQPHSDLAGTTIADSGIRERTGANVVGAWFQGEFKTPPPPDARIDGRTILLVAGHETQLEQLKQLTLSERRRQRRGPVIVCGYGEVGSTIARRVRQAGVDCTIVDREPGTAVDVQGDATDVETLQQASIESARTVMLALSNDREAVFATLVARQLDPDVEVVARANSVESVQKLYRAGADYALALDTVSGRMLASRVLDEDVLSFDQQVEVLRSQAGNLAGQTLESANIRARTNCTVLAIERDGDVLTTFDATFPVEAGDTLVVAGPDESVSAFTAMVN